MLKIRGAVAQVDRWPALQSTSPSSARPATGCGRRRTRSCSRACQLSWLRTLLLTWLLTGLLMACAPAGPPPAAPPVPGPRPGTGAVAAVQPAAPAAPVAPRAPAQATPRREALPDPADDESAPPRLTPRPGSPGGPGNSGGPGGVAAVRKPVEGASEGQPQGAVVERPAQPEPQPPTAAAPEPPPPPPATLLVPASYDPSRSYPVLVVLPYTGGTAENFLEYYLFSEYNPQRTLQEKWERSLRAYYPNARRRKARAYIILVPEGVGSRKDHSAVGFERAILRYEARIEAGLREAEQRYHIDRSRIVLAGHSLGGDLAWAITLRHPERYAGAFISGSRTSYREDGKANVLAQRPMRYFFAMGETEAALRMKGLDRTLLELEGHGVNFSFRRTPGVGHLPPARLGLARALDYVFHGPPPPAIAPPRPAAAKAQFQAQAWDAPTQAPAAPGAATPVLPPARRERPSAAAAAPVPPARTGPATPSAAKPPGKAAAKPPQAVATQRKAHAPAPPVAARAKRPKPPAPPPRKAAGPAQAGAKPPAQSPPEKPKRGSAVGG